jgi:hypothetical protein
VPDAILIDPLLAAFDVPELNTSFPLPPCVPLFVVIMHIAPVLEHVPSPERNSIAPPVLSELSPEAKVSAPPLPLVPLPTLRQTPPPRPLVAALEPIVTDPQLPPQAVPDAKKSLPLDPEQPELAVQK